MSEWATKRFWKQAEAIEVTGGFSVELDGRKIKTPAKADLVLPTLAMARAIAVEWDAQEEKIDPTSMPLTKSANAALDKVRVQHSEVADMIADYGDCDLLCYRAENPAKLVARQADVWNPVLDWAVGDLGVKLETRSGVMYAPQEQGQIKILRGMVHALGDFHLAGFHDLVMLSGSLIIGFATAKDAFSTQELWDMSRLDEIWQSELWGVDDDAEENSAIKARAFAQAKRFYDLSATHV